MLDEFDRVMLSHLPRTRDRPLLLNHLNQPSAFFVRSVQNDIDVLETYMAKRTNKPVRNNPSMFNTTFVEVRLGNAEKNHFHQWMEQDQETLGIELGTFISNDHKLSVSWDDQNVCFVASATCRDESSVNHNCCITSRSQDWFEAIMLTLYKATVLLGDKAWQSQSSDRSWG